MFSDDVVLRLEDVGKCFQIYALPRDRLKQFVLPRVRRMAGLSERSYARDFWALRGLSLEVRRGEAVAIIGRNGSGKSTLLQIVTGVLSPTEGRVTVNGKIAALLELGSGFNPEFTGRENVFLNGVLLGLKHSEVEKKFDDIVAFADIGNFIDQPVKTYSSGMFVRLAFAVVAHVNADILIVDEALAVGDVFFQQKCMRYLRAFQERGGTMLFVSHDTGAVVNLCRTALWLKNSTAREFFSGPAETVCKEYLRDLYGQRDSTFFGNVAATASLDASPSELQAASNPILGRTVHAPDPQDACVIEISSFRSGAEYFGAGGATFSDVVFVDETGAELSSMQAGQRVTVCASVRAHKSITYPAFGITIKDRLGQFIISESTDGSFRSKQLAIAAEDVLVAEISFRVPTLIQGIYSVDVAFAEGPGHDHIQHQWIHDALTLTVVSGRLVQGIYGLDDWAPRLIHQSTEALS